MDHTFNNSKNSHTRPIFRNVSVAHHGNFAEYGQIFLVTLELLSAWCVVSEICIQLCHNFYAVSSSLILILTSLVSYSRKPSKQSCKLYRSMYCLCVSMYCTTATGCQPNCS